MSSRCSFFLALFGVPDDGHVDGNIDSDVDRDFAAIQLESSKAVSVQLAFALASSSILIHGPT